jgi:hypothetical protein
MPRALAPYRNHALALGYTVFLLVADSRASGLVEQDALGGLTFAVLLLCGRSVPPAQRRQLLACVVLSTGFEILGSQIWGVYHYRWGNVPWYVPPGHGLVYWFGLTAVDLPVFRRHGRRAALPLLGLAAAWAVAGLTVIPLLGGRLDIHGAMCLPAFALCITKARRYWLFAAVFVAVANLELWGTLLGDWTWVAVAPWDHIPQGNPPSAIAGGYAVIEASVALALAGVARVTRPLRRPALAEPVAA